MKNSETMLKSNCKNINPNECMDKKFGDSIWGIEGFVEYRWVSPDITFLSPQN
jgi:hypothetical protein